MNEPINVNENERYAVSFKEIKSLIRTLQKKNAKWKGEVCPNCEVPLKERNYFLLNGCELACPECEMGYIYADRFVKTFLSKKKNVSSKQKQMRSLIRQEGKKGKVKISDYGEQ